MSFNCALILIISFLLLTLSFVCCFSRSYRYRVRLFIWAFCIIFWGRPVLLWTSLSVLPSLCPIGFGLLCLHFHLFPESYWLPPWSLCQSIHDLIACYSICMYWNVFEFFPWGWFLVLSHCDLSICLIWFQFSWICWSLFCVLPCGLSLKMFHVHSKIIYILLLWG